MNYDTCAARLDANRVKHNFIRDRHQGLPEAIDIQSTILHALHLHIGSYRRTYVLIDLSTAAVLTNSSQKRHATPLHGQKVTRDHRVTLV